jgi:hypothetical protein
MKYETVANVVCGFICEDGLLLTTDDMSGYWNLLLHPDMYGIAAFELDNDLYYFRAMAFGFAPACMLGVHAPEARGTQAAAGRGLGPGIPH